jgi:hypothetical protein
VEKSTETVMETKAGHAHINRGVDVKYTAYARLPGCRSWTMVGRRDSESKAGVAKYLAVVMAAGEWREGKILMTADYYNPVVVMTMRNS